MRRVHIKWNKDGNTITDNNMRFKRSPTYENLLRICSVITPEMIRAGVNTDNIGAGEYMMTDSFCIAAVLKGYKAVAWIRETNFYPFMGEIGFKSITVISPNNRKSYVIYISDDNEVLAQVLADQLTSDTRDHEAIGRLLGYRQEDIDLFVLRHRTKNNII